MTEFGFFRRNQSALLPLIGVVVLLQMVAFRQDVRLSSLLAPPRRQVAVTVLFAAGNRVVWGEGFGPIVDGACVLRHTMLKHAPHDVDITFVGLIKNFTDVPETFLAPLRHCGFVFRVALPTVNLTKIGHVRARAASVRAVGIVELLKLESLLMTEYEVVLCLDADIMFVGPFDDLIAPYTAAPYRLSIDFNGGMIVFYPRNDGLAHVRGLLHTFSHTPWTKENGYGGTGLGEVHPPFGISGGPMNQGLLPYYLNAVVRVNPRGSSHGITPCRHNYCFTKPGTGFCSEWPSDQIRSVHLKGSSFPKPWECRLLDELSPKCPIPSYRERQAPTFSFTPHAANVSHIKRCSYFHTWFLIEHAEMLQKSFRVAKPSNGCIAGMFHGVSRYSGNATSLEEGGGDDGAAGAVTDPTDIAVAHELVDDQEEEEDLLLSAEHDPKGAATTAVAPTSG